MTPTTKAPSNAIGHIITWQSPTSVLVSVVRTALITAALDPKLARDLHDYSKLARTARGMAKTRNGTKRIARTIEGKRARQLTRENQTLDSLTYRKEAVLAVDKGVLKCDAPELQSEALAEFALVGDRRTAQDITRLLKRIVEQAGSDLMPLRDQGGVYFVPSGHRVLTQLETLMTQLGGSLRKFACTMGDGSAQSIADVVSDYLIGEIKALRESVADLDKDARADVKARRVERLGELRLKMSAYATLLAAGASTVERALLDADNEIMTKLAVSTS